MKIYKRVITTLFALMLLPTFSVYQVWAKTPQNNIRTFDEALGLSFRYLISKQNDDYSWITNNHDDTADIINLLEHLNSDPNISMFESYENFQFIIKQSADHLISKNYFNTDDVTHYLLCDILQKDEEAYSIMLNSQNPDGGFGLAENYASDIIDTKLALKALADLGETEAMTNAAMYIASLQNDDGGFSYQKGLASNPELTAEIADIFGDCIIKDDVDIRWSIISNNEVIDSDSIEVTEADLAAETIHLTDFTPNTSTKRSYTISAELVSNNLVVVQASTNYFVSDKGVAVVTDVDKEYLYETSDEAEISVRLRDERVVDLIFTTSSQDTELITQYADQVDAIKNQLEHLGYIVNLSSVDTSYLTARDTFAWIEYDHPNYNTQSPYTKHIVYEEDNIKMLGYTAVPYKDFLLVPDDNDSRKIFTFDIQRDTTDWHSMNGGGFLFNTVIEDNTISGYYVLITGNGLKLYSLNALNLDTFRNTGNQGTLLQTFPFSNVYDEHHIVINADSESLSLWDGENIVINDYSLPTQYGNGYGPITSHASHGCSQRSYFTFANITMQTITGEKLSDVLDNYNFESPNSRYVINLSDDTLENLDTEDDYDEVAQKIIDNNITFIGLGNDSNRSQYQTLLSEIGSNGMYYDFLNTATETNLNNYIITREENKRVKIDNDIVATDLVFKGTLSDGTEVTWLFDELCVGETINFTIPTEPDNLTAGIDAVLLDNITLTYSDENGIRRVVNSDPMTLPVLMPETKITNQVSTDKPEYSSYQNVVIFDRIHNVFNNRSAKNLTNVITVLDYNDEVIEEYTSALPELMPNGFTERRVTWNTSDNLAGTYTVRSDVYDGDRLLSRSTADFSISISSTTDIKLIGQLAISDKTYDVSDSITINTSIENAGHSAVTNARTLIKIFDVENETVVYV